MNCNIVKDLIPLCIDDCCSEDSKIAVTEHINECSECRKLYEEMRSPRIEFGGDEVRKKDAKPRRISDWKASVLQSVLLFVSFGLITFGVALEAKTGYHDILNRFWAFNIVVPTTAFMLSLANWYFVRLYKSRRWFSNCSLLLTIVFTLIAFIWTFYHYDRSFLLLLREMKFFIIAGYGYLGIGLCLTVVFCVLSKVLSNLYAKLLGKE